MKTNSCLYITACRSKSDRLLGIQPKEDVDLIKGSSVAGNSSDATERVLLTGGAIWYTYPIHIPLLDIRDDHYHVAASGVGMEGFRPLDTKRLTAMKQVDVFFLLDGTASMEPYIKAAIQTVKDIGDTLRKALGFQETSFRFGYRIYRDTYADKLIDACRGGICEGLALPPTTCRSDNRMTDANWRQFVDELSPVRETRNDADDFPEKLFDGLRQAIQDMASCDQRAKLLFVIGDHGDREVSPPADVIAKVKEIFGKWLIIFIQTPNNQLKVHDAQAYKAAYETFSSQAREIINRTLPETYRGKPIQRSDYLLSLNEEEEIAKEEIPKKVIDLVEQFTPSHRVIEIEQALRGGDSLREILKKHMKEGDMPVLYAKWVDDSSCEALGAQCETQVDHRVMDFYIPVEKEKIQEEVWMTGKSLNNWLRLLRPFEDLPSLRVEQQRQEFAKLLKEQVQAILGGPPLEDDKPLKEQIERIVQRKNFLPIREEGPLLQYTIREISQGIEGCELLRLIKWVNSIYGVLVAVSGSPTLKVSFTLEYPPTSPCPLSEKGKRVPTMTFQQRERLGPDDTYRYDHEFYGEKIYWLPIEFLP
jgi:hypothetical protein